MQKFRKSNLFFPTQRMIFSHTNTLPILEDLFVLQMITMQFCNDIAFIECIKIDESQVQFLLCDNSVQLYKLDVPEFDVTMSIGWLHHGDHPMTSPEQKVIELLERESQRFQDMNS